MNQTHLRYISQHLARAGLFVIASLAFALPAGAAINDEITRQVWKMKHGVSDSQLNQTAADAGWLAMDDDKDGNSNGAELALGTDPFVANTAATVLKVTTLSIDATNVSLTFPTVSSKTYAMQHSSSLSSPSWVDATVAGVTGDGAPKTLGALRVANPGPFYRIIVRDIDTDNDGASDWAEVAAGYNPNNQRTNGGTTLDGPVLAGAIATSNIVTVSVTKSNALQPADAVSAPVETGSITISRSGPLRLRDITVPLQKAGTATAGTDYRTETAGIQSEDLPANVTFTKAGSATQGGASEVVIKINPKYNLARKTNVTAIVKALAGAGYTVGSTDSGAVVINPTGIANGTGLTGKYWNTSSLTPSAQATIFAGTPQMNRTDATVDFSNGVNGWGAPAGPAGMSSVSSNTAFSVRWTGQILPQYSENYYIDFRSDDGAKVWVNGVLLIDRWAAQSATDYINSINLTAGVLYDIKVEYLNVSGNAEAKLYWWSASRPKEIIPTARLFPEPAQPSEKPTAIVSSLTAVGYQNVPFSFSVASPDIGGTINYALDPNSGPLPPALPGLPSRLTLNATTGVISGTPATAGTYNVAINAINAAAVTPTGSSVLTITIFPTGGVTREVLGTTGSGVSQIVIPTGDPGHTTIPTIDDNADLVQNTGVRLRGYIVPPKTGNYHFWIAADNEAELWISNDSQYVNRVRRASVISTTGYKAWSALDDNTKTPPVRPQMSPWLSLVAGEKYYFEVLHNTGAAGDDHVAVSWCQDDVGSIPAATGAPNPNGLLVSIPDGDGPLQGYPFSGQVPGFVCLPYDYPPVTPPTGKLYACNLGPQGSAISSASGSASLQVNAAETQAILHFSYQNLGSARIAYHLHVDGYTSDPSFGGSPATGQVHPAGEIVFDLDDADALPELRTADGGYVWSFAQIGSFVNVPMLVDAIKSGKVYLNVHSAIYPAGEIRGNFNLIEGSQTPPDPSLYVEPPATDNPASGVDTARTQAAARFLNQATFGASPADVEEVKTVGFNQWITNQLGKPTTRTSGDVVAGVTANINDLYPSALFTNTWWKNSITAPDQLRQRVAFALSEIMVISWANDTGPLAKNARILADYYDNLVDYCLPTAGLADSGNFRGILKAVTMTPAMGKYLDMLGNQKGDLTIGRVPNENYAREIMQLFSAGLYRLWDDGRYVLGSDAGLVPTYGQPSIWGLAKLLTGWNYAQASQTNGRAPTGFSPGADYLNPMVLVPNYHELGPKLLLNNVVAPAATGMLGRVSVATVVAASPGCLVTTTTPHGLKVGDTVTITGVTGGSYSSAINASHHVTAVLDYTTFKIGIDCTASPTNNTGTVTGATVLHTAFKAPSSPLAINIPPISGSQADNSGTGTPHPFDQYGLNELNMAIDNIVNNDNVPPYFCRLLIQRLVTSEPSPGYVYRVVQKFKNNGSGVRGDMAAVVRQILMDGEARSYGLPQAQFTAANRNAFGKQREPMLRLTGVSRAFPAASYTGTYQQLSGTSSNKLRLVTSRPNDFSAGFTVALDFRGNYATTTPPSPYTNPTSTSYSIGTTTAIAATHLGISGITPDVGPPAKTIITCTQPHGLGANGATAPIWFFGLSGKFSDAGINSGIKTGTVTSPNTFTITPTTNYVFQVASVSIGTPCTVTTAAPHGLPAGATTGVTINGIVNGTFSGGATSLNGTNFTVTNTGANTFTVASSALVNVTCSAVPTGYTTWRQSSNPCRVTTVTPHGLANGDSVTISGVTGGSFSPSTPGINGTYLVSEVAPSAFTIAGLSANSPSNPNTGNIVGSNTMEVTATGIALLNGSTTALPTYSQTAGSSTMTVNTSGPETNKAVPGTATFINSKVYIAFVSRTSVLQLTSMAVSDPVVITKVGHGLVSGDTVTISGVTGGTFVSGGVTSANNINKTHTVSVSDADTFTVPVQCTEVPTAAGIATGSFGPTAADGVYGVQSNGSGNFTVTTADIPTATRTGSVVIPKIPTSYTPITSNTIVQFNTNVNHNLNSTVATQIWVDVPVNVTVLTDAEYTVPAATATLGVTDEDHFKTSYLPTNLNGGTYPKPSGSNNSVTIWPLVPAPLGRSGNLNINQSTFVLGSTESTLTQSPLNAPTVFNFFLPDYKFPGTLANNGLDSPEFQLSTDTNLSNLTNSLTNMFLSTGGGNGNLNGLNSFNAGGGSVVVDIGNTNPLLGPIYMTAAKTANGGIPGLIDELASLLVGAPLEANSKETIRSFVANTTNFPYTIGSPTNQQMRDRVRAIIHLIITSAEYAVQK